MQYMSHGQGSVNVMADSSMSTSMITRAKNPAANSEMAMRRMPAGRMGLVDRSGGPCLCRKLSIRSDGIHEVDYRQL